MPRNFTQLTMDERRIVSQMLQAKAGWSVDLTPGTQEAFASAAQSP